MQIQKGLVKYKDRTDIVCTYGLTDEGRQYYFLDNTSMSNGNIIASTVLVEAIDPVAVASSVGVIDANGTVVIPFENKSIKPLIDGLLLVEVANSTTPSVVEANSLRSDPLAATKLVTTPATIKENINAKMGAEGRFVFNDQFSEATICDYDGNNILDNQYFSFIAIKNNETLYLSKNTADSPVLEYSLVNRMFVAAAPEAPLDVQNTEVTQETIDGAMQAEEKAVGFSADDITAKDFEAVADGGMEEPLPVEPAVVNPDEAVVSATEVAPIAPEATEEVVDEVEDDGEEPISVIPDALAAEAPVEEAPAEEVPAEEVVNVTSEVDAPLNINMDDIDVNPPAPIEGMENPDVTEETPVEAQEDGSTEEGEDSSSTDGGIGVVDESQYMTPKEEETTSGDEFTGMVVPEDTSEESVEETVESPVNEVTPEESTIDSSFEEAMAKALESQAEEEVQETAPIEEETNNVVEENASNSDDLMNFDFADNTSTTDFGTDMDVAVDDMVSEFKNDLFNEDLSNDIFADSAIHADSINVEDSYSDFDYKVSSGAKDSIIEDVASTMSNLIRQNKEQKDKIALYEDKLDQAAGAYKKVVEKAKLQLRDAELLKNKVKNFETLVTKLEAKLEVLENKVRDQDRLIASQTRELESLRPQVEGKEELVKILADAQNLLDQSI